MCKKGVENMNNNLNDIIDTVNKINIYSYFINNEQIEKFNTVKKYFNGNIGYNKIELHNNLLDLCTIMHCLALNGTKNKIVEYINKEL